MEYKVIPFAAHIDHRTVSSNNVTLQLEQLINKYNQDGWTYIRMETVSNNVASDAGCFGLGAKPGFTLVSNMLVFKK